MKLKVLLVLFFALNTALYADTKQQKPINTPNTDVSVIFRKINHASYCTDVLPHDFSCLLQLLEHGNHNKKDPLYFERVLRLFTRLAKEAPCINAYAFNDLVARMPSLLKNSTTLHAQKLLDTKSLLEMDIIDRFKGSVNSLLYSQFLNDYSGFKKDPDTFLEQASDQITGILEEEWNVGQMRTIVVRFLEVCLAKLAWSPDNYEQIWQSTKGIARNLGTFIDQHILEDVDDLDDTLWSLVYRFHFFVDIFGNNLPLEFYNTASTEINNQKLLLTELEEQQDWLIGKAQFLQNSIQGAKTRMLAFEKGILAR
jgi:hypothetical protein